MDTVRPRINAELLATNQGKPVCMLGIAHSPGQDGQSFMLTTSDKQNVTVRMQEPLNEYIDGLVEIIGEVDARNNIICQSYVSFPLDISKNFDMASYNRAVELMNQLPQHYVTGVPETPAQ